MKKHYEVEVNSFDLSITLEIDTTKMTAEIAAQVNGFWAGAESVLESSDGDIFQAVARRAAWPLMHYLLVGYHETGAVEELSEQEGWPDKDHIGITIIDHVIPDLDPTMYEVEELEVGA